MVPCGPGLESVRLMAAICARLAQTHMSGEAVTAAVRGRGCVVVVGVDASTRARQLDAISQCVAHIFDAELKQARKKVNSAYRALRHAAPRLHLCACLQARVQLNQCLLGDEQFDLVARLLNEALECSSNSSSRNGEELSGSTSRCDEYALGQAVLPLATSFYRKLANGALDQCVYTRLQHHALWSSMAFWETAFYADVQRSIRPVYLSNEQFAAEQQRTTQLQQQQQQQQQHKDDEAAAGSRSRCSSPSQQQTHNQRLIGG